MYDFILQIAVFLSLGLIIVLLARALPRIEEDKAPAAKKSNVFDKILSRLPLAKIDLFVNSVLGKILRRMKVVVLKADNLINNYLGKLKKTNGNGNVNGSDGNKLSQ